MNPLLNFTGLIAFDQITPEHITPAIASLLEENRTVLAQLEHAPATWQDFIEPLEAVTEKLSRAWKAVEHLNSVVDTPELRAVYNHNLPLVTEFWTQLGQNLALYKQYQALAGSEQYQRFTPTRQRIIQHALRDFKLGGAELSEPDKQAFAAISERLAALAQQFSEHVLDATNDYALYIEDVNLLAGMPADALAAARAGAEKDGRAAWKITLHMPSYLAVMQHVAHRPLREQLYQAYVTRASEFGPPAWDNSALVLEILQLRHEQAQLLGYKNFAQVSLVAKMADEPQQVMQFLNDLALRAKPYGQRDIDELRRFAGEHLGIADLQSWDMMYASEKLREQRYAFSEQQVKQYFQEPQVLAGLFGIVESLFAVRIQPDQAPVWHPDVRFFRVESCSGQLIAQFYLDLYARPGKRSGAWMDDARSRKRVDGTTAVQTPIALLTCNFSEPINGKPALFSHDEVITLFHEFGHGLHHMLTHIDEIQVAGIHGVEWDAVELPSQFMENFCWEWQVLEQMTAHVESAARLPRALFDKMRAAKNFQAGLQMLRQIELALLDMHLHSDFDAHGNISVQQLIEQVRGQVAVLHPPAYNRFQNQFAHIFAGGYAAGYYSYQWAEVLSADAFAKFAEAGVLDAQTGAQFREEILSVGGSRPALESFTAFRGRPPSIDALLRHNGLVDQAR